MSKIVVLTDRCIIKKMIGQKCNVNAPLYSIGHDSTL